MSSTILPLSTSTPENTLPSEWYCLSFIIESSASSPALSASIVGISSSASANASIASCCLPPTFLANSLSFSASSTSGAPPPPTTLGSLSTFLSTWSASSILLSASSRSMSFAPLTRMVTLLGFFAPSMNIILSLPTFLSSTSSASPRSSALRSLSVLIILAPVAFAIFSISLLLTLLTAIIPFLAR